MAATIAPLPIPTEELTVILNSLLTRSLKAARREGGASVGSIVYDSHLAAK